MPGSVQASRACATGAPAHPNTCPVVSSTTGAVSILWPLDRVPEMQSTCHRNGASTLDIVSSQASEYAFRAYASNQIDQTSNEQYGYPVNVAGPPDHRRSDGPLRTESGFGDEHRSESSGIVVNGSDSALQPDSD
jgi:hypothetical protein